MSGVIGHRGMLLQGEAFQPGNLLENFLGLTTGAPVFAYTFDGNYNDSSGNNQHASADGSGNSFVPNTLNGDGGSVLRLNGNGNAIGPNAATVLGNNPRTFFGMCKPTYWSSGHGLMILHQVGSDSGSHPTFGVGFAGTPAAPILRLDWNRAVSDVVIPSAWVQNWMAIVVTHTPGQQRLYICPKGGNFTLVATYDQNLNTNFTGGGGNYLGSWKWIRRFVGDVAFLGLRTGVMDVSDLQKFRI